MSEYTTGELAKLCGVSVRTVQFYDTKEILKPSSLSEGGRRLYDDGDLKKMQFICLLKSLGLSLDSIRGILESDAPDKVLMLLLGEQTKQLTADIDEMEKQKQTISIVRKSIEENQALPVKSIADIGRIMDDKKKLNRLHWGMLALGIPASVILWGTVVLWIVTGIWWPFVAAIPVVVAICCGISAKYYRSTEYICPECGERFTPPFREVFWARHNTKTRKLTCPKCGKTCWCIEAFASRTD